MTSQIQKRSYVRAHQPNLRSRSARPDMLREINIQTLLGLISTLQPISRADLAKTSGMTRATVSTITATLLNAGYLVEDGPRQSSALGGKPPVPLRLNSRRFGIFGLDVRADSGNLALCDFNTEIVAQKTVRTSRDPRQFLTSVAGGIRAFQESHRDFDEFAGIGVSLPGLVNHESGTFLSSVVLPWRNIPIAEQLEQMAGIPVWVDNSARCGSLAEIWIARLQRRHVRNLLYVNVSAGLACGVVIDGTTYGGVNDSAGQFGHMSIDVNGPECRCGQRGCWDLFASDTATIARYLQIKGDDGSRPPAMRELIDLIESGDTAAIEAVRETARYLALGINGLINGLDPELVVVGGVITRAWPLLEPVLKGIIGRNRLHQFAQDVEIRSSSLGVSPSLKGAVTLVLSQLLSAPDIV